MDGDEITIDSALAKYFEAASTYNDLLSSKGGVPENVVRECANWMMLFLYLYNQPENWTPENTPRVAIPPQLANDIARNLQMVLSGHIPQWMLHLQKQGAPQAHPRMAAGIGVAVAYKKLAAAGAIGDSQSTKTVSKLYGVSPRGVQNWMKEYSFCEPADFFPHAGNEADRATQIAAELPRAAASYREWGRGLANQRPFGKAGRRPRAKS
jgi:hypothetical protein